MLFPLTLYDDSVWEKNIQTLQYHEEKHINK